MLDPTLKALRAATGRAEDPYTVRPVEQVDREFPARYRASPTSTGEAAAILAEAASQDLAVVATGGMTKQDWAHPPSRVDLIVDTRRLTGLVEHSPGDLIAVARAGTRMRDLNAALAPAGQHLALDTPLPGATVGGTVAVNASGPRRMAYGTARDLLIGVTVVRPDGVVARSGGKVVKNVAGYDLGKLVTGSYGTLGLITECVFRLHPVPPASAYVSARVAHVDAAGRLVAAVLAAQVAPSGLEVNAPPEGEIEVTALLEGTADGVAGRAADTARLLGAGARVDEAAPPGWSTYPWRIGSVGLKLTATLSGVPRLLATARAAARRHQVPVRLRGSAGAGVLYAGLPGPLSPDVLGQLLDRLRSVAHDNGGHVVVLTAPPALRARVDLWGPVPGLDLMRRVKQQFDPDGRFAPGRFVGGI